MNNIQIPLTSNIQKAQESQLDVSLLLQYITHYNVYYRIKRKNYSR